MQNLSHLKLGDTVVIVSPSNPTYEVHTVVRIGKTFIGLENRRKFKITTGYEVGYSELFATASLTLCTEKHLDYNNRYEAMRIVRNIQDTLNREFTQRNLHTLDTESLNLVASTFGSLKNALKQQGYVGWNGES